MRRVKCPFCWAKVAWSGMRCHLDRSVTCQQWQQHMCSGATTWAKPAVARPFECFVCGRKFKTQWDLSQHGQMAHPAPEDAPAGRGGVTLTSAVRGRSEPAAEDRREGRPKHPHALPSVHSAPAAVHHPNRRERREASRREGREEEEQERRRRSRSGDWASRSRERQRRRVERRQHRSIRRRAQADPEEGDSSQNRRERTFADLVAMGTKIFGSGSGQGE